MKIVKIKLKTNQNQKLKSK